jgi:tryptophan synthase alpha chain
MTGVERISAAFRTANAERRAAFMPYHAMGYPDRTTSVDIVAALAKGGADIFEIGIPHSDPLADGPTIQAATQTSLSQGTTVADCLEMVRELRAGGVEQPFCGMSYLNPIHAYGIERFVRDAASAGFDGLIVPDLPPEEATVLEPACRRAGLATVYLLAPTSDPERIALVARHATGFVYLVSIVGITGTRDQLPVDLATFVGRVRRATNLPLAVGFGIGTQEQAAAVAGMADGVIVGSALIRAAGSDRPLATVRTLAAELSAGTRRKE